MSSTIVLVLRFRKGSSTEARREVIDTLEGAGFRRVGNSLTWIKEGKAAKITVSLDAFFRGDEEGDGTQQS